MPNFVQLTDTRGVTFQLNYDRIIKIQMVKGGGTAVILDSGGQEIVKQSTKQVTALIEKVEFYRKKKEFKSQIKWAKQLTEEEYGA